MNRRVSTLLKLPFPALLLLLLWQPHVLLGGQSSVPADARPLDVNQPIERELAGKELHAYQITLSAGQYLHAVFEQEGIDLYVRVFDPAQKQVGVFNSPNGTEGPEAVAFTAETPGTYRLDVRAVFDEASAGRYKLRVDQLLSPEQNALRVAAEKVRDEAVVRWIAQNALPLKSIEAGHGFEDLRPLKKVLQNVRVVGLGEATHGTHEFFQLKHRMVEFLVREMGFNVFAIEASYPAALKINEYVLNGKGDRDKALAGQGLWAWDTKEVSALIDWMREYNRTAPAAKKVRFVGFDMHNNELALDEILAYLRRVAPERSESAAATFQPLRPLGPGRQHFDYSNRTDAEKTRTLAELNELAGFLSLNRARFTRQTSPEEFERISEFVRIVAQFADVYRHPYFDAKNPANSNGVVRDYYMAENILRLIEAEGAGARFIIWAHNDHIGVSNDSMGEHLRKAYKDAYYALGFSFNKGQFQAREMSREVTIGALAEFSIGDAREGSVEWYFTRTNLKAFLIDYRLSSKDRTVNEWLDTYRHLRSIGLGYTREWKDRSFKIDLRRTYDGMVFIETTTRAMPNPTGMREPWMITSTGNK